jgi:hypothetical protein
MAQELILKKINDAANMWNKTKDPQYKDLWYKLIKEFDDVRNNYNYRSNSSHNLFFKSIDLS